MSPYRSADGWRLLDDPVRGRRRYRFDPSGLPREAWLADGRHLHFAHEDNGHLRALACDDGYRLDLVSGRPREIALRLVDNEGTTDVRLGARSQRLERGGAALEIARDDEGRPVRVELPGSGLSLRYRWRDDGTLDVETGDGASLLTVRGPAARRRFEIAGIAWQERASPRGLRIAAGALEGRIATDPRGRVVERSWSGRLSESFERDDGGRLSRWIIRPAGRAAREHRYRFAGGRIVGEEIRAEGRCEVLRRCLDEGGRVLAVDGGGGGQRRYGYDGAGRRLWREDAGGITRYAYDPLGKLVRVERPDGVVVRMTYDGLGRRVRIAVAGETRFEHRDARGRLWAVTDAAGRALRSYLWLGERVIARIDGALGEPVAEVFLSDPWGTLAGVLTCDRDGRCAVLPVAIPPYGSAVCGTRPTLYGHFADPETGLIHCGGRDLDPELGVFLTPDPWHGGLDDPRRWARVSEVELACMREVPAARVDAYALCQLDPLAAADRDGHSTGSFFLSLGRSLLHLILAPTWGMPLTSISLFVFLPLSLYVELLGFFWAPLHSVLRGTRLLAGSWRQGLFTFALNGFVPGFFVSGLNRYSDRAVTIGNVVWISRHELALLDRPTALEVEDISGQGGAARFNDDPAKRSLVALESTESGKRRIRVSYWCRGFGSEIVMAGPPGATVPTFRDRAVGGSHRGVIQLAKPLPEDFPVAEKQDSSVRLKLREYLHDTGANHHSTAELVELSDFVLRFDDRDIKLRPGDPIEVRAASAAVDPAYFVIAEVLRDDKFDQAVLYSAFPAHLNGPPPVTSDMSVTRMADGPEAASAGWTVPGADRKVLSKAGPFDPPKLHKGGTLRVEATTADGAIANPLPGAAPHATANQNRHAAIARLQSTVDVDAPAPAVAIGWDAFVMTSAGNARAGRIPDLAKPRELQVAGHGLAVGGFLSLRLAAGGAVTYARVAAVNGNKLEVDYLAPPLPLPAAAPVAVTAQKLEDVSPATDKGEVKVVVDADTFGIEVDRLQWLKPQALLHLVSLAGDHLVRKIMAVAAAEVELQHYEVVGGGPYTLRTARPEPGFSQLRKVRRSSLRRFLKHTGGADPAAYGAYDGFVLAVELTSATGIARDSAPLASEFYIRSNAADLHKDFRGRWQPAQIGADKYWLLDQDLPIETGVASLSGRTVWRIDPEAHDVDLEITGGPPFTFHLREFEHHGVERPLAGGRRVTAHPPEVQVPVAPELHDTHKSALIEHEIHHAVQNNHYGPIMGALPIQGVIRVTTFATADELPEWMREGFSENNSQIDWLQVFSIGGIMQNLWKYVFLAPAHLDDDASAAILERDFDFWNRIFNPFWGNLIARFPEIQRRTDDPEFEPDFGPGFGLGLAQLLAMVMDLRSWTPLLGFVPFMLPDSAKNPIEQQASRASGDLYSSILTADDKFNYIIDTRSYLPDVLRDSHAADLTRPLGTVVRLMMFCQYRLDRLLRFNRADAPGSPLAYFNGVPFFPYEDPLRIEITAGAGMVLVHSDLYEVQPARPVRALAGPPGLPAPVDFAEAQVGDRLVPLLRALVPTPPRVNRSTGVFLIAASEGSYTCTMPQGQGAGTNTAVIKIESKVAYGEDDVPWRTPTPAAGGPKITRWATEIQDLVIKDRAPDGHELVIDNPPAAANLITRTVGARGWTLKVDAANHGPSNDVRLRIFRTFKKNDAANPRNNDPAFDLKFSAEGAPALNGVTSFLDKDLWVLVRDFLVEVKELPALAAATVKSNVPHPFDVAIPLLQDAPIRVTPKPANPGAPRFPDPTKVGAAVSAAFPRGERWRVGPLDKVVEDPVVYEVRVTFGRAGHSVAHVFDLTVEPAIHLTHAAGPAPFQATAASALVMDIAGGTAPYAASAEGLPAGSRTVIAGTQVRVEVTAAPAAATAAVVIVRDSSSPKLEGRRRIRVLP